MAETIPTNKTDAQLQKRLQNLFNKGFSAFERGSLDMAIELLYNCVELSPDFFRARKFLRAACLQKATKSRPHSVVLQLMEVLAAPAFIKTKMLLKKNKHNEALLAVEKLLQKVPLSTKAVCLAADCAIAAKQIESAIMYLETALQVDMQNPDIMLHLVHTYRVDEQWKKAREILNALAQSRPLDERVTSLLKDTDAHLAMADTWDSAAQEGGDYRKLIKDQDATSKREMQSRAVIEGEDAETLIAEQRAKIEAEPHNLNYYRGLARILQQQKRFDEAIEVIVAAREINPADPDLDRTLSHLRIQGFDARVQALRDQDQEEQAQTVEGERDQFVFDDLVQRVERYPNDLRLRFELGMQYLKYEAYDDAIQQFQLAQRSPKERNEALYGLARCFRMKGQGDMATMQLETALEQLPVMDDMRKKVLFDLGEINEEAGNIEKAFTIYREIYGADIGYRDIGDKMERIYKLRKSE